MAPNIPHDDEPDLPFERVPYLDTDHIIGIIDVDSFAVQVHTKDDYPHYDDIPCATILKSGRIISVNRAAKNHGIDRKFLDGTEMTADDAKEIFSRIQFFEVPQKYGKPYMALYDRESDKILDAILKFARKYGITVEKVSLDEAFIDLTSVLNHHHPIDEDCYVCSKWKDEGEDYDEMPDCFRCFEKRFDTNRLMKMSIFIVNEMKSYIYNKTKYWVTIATGFNKLLAKINCNYTKIENGYGCASILEDVEIPYVFNKTPINKVYGLGENLGRRVMSVLNIKHLGELRRFDMSDLTSALGRDNAMKLIYNAYGIDDREVIHKTCNNKVTSGKQFFNGVTSFQELYHWTKNNSKALVEKLEYDRERNRRETIYFKGEFKFRNRSYSKKVKIVCYHYDWKEIADAIIYGAFPKCKIYSHEIIDSENNCL